MIESFGLFIIISQLLFCVYLWVTVYRLKVSNACTDKLLKEFSQNISFYIKNTDSCMRNIKNIKGTLNGFSIDVEESIRELSEKIKNNKAYNYSDINDIKNIKDVLNNNDLLLKSFKKDLYLMFKSFKTLEDSYYKNYTNTTSCLSVNKNIPYKNSLPEINRNDIL